MEKKEVSMPQRQIDEEKLYKFINIEPSKEKKKEINVCFIKKNKEIQKFIIQIDSNEKVSSLIQKYRDMSGDFEKEDIFLYNLKLMKSFSLNCSDFGIDDYSIIHVIGK